MTKRQQMIFEAMKEIEVTKRRLEEAQRRLCEAVNSDDGGTLNEVGKAFCFLISQRELYIATGNYRLGRAASDIQDAMTDILQDATESAEKEIARMQSEISGVAKTK